MTKGIIDINERLAAVDKLVDAVYKKYGKEHSSEIAYDAIELFAYRHSDSWDTQADFDDSQ